MLFFISENLNINMIKKIPCLFISLFIILLIPSCATEELATDDPNIIYILADDLGYGDVSAFNPASKIITPNIDMLASAGMVFTDAHSGSSVGAPSRYGILTGRYSWRTGLKEGAIGGTDRPLVDSTRLSLASVLKQKDYNTAYIGKWQLGLGWKMNENESSIDFSSKLTAGPGSYGFDYSFIIPASLDTPPYVYIENHEVISLPDRLTSGSSGFGSWEEGLTGEGFQHKDVLPEITDKAVEWISEKEDQEDPFFLFLSLSAPHTPILPAEEFVGKSNTNPYGDFVLMLDDMVGRVTDALDRINAAENTMIIFASDNGCSPDAGLEQLAELGHSPGYVYRGHKGDIYEAGHRIPLLIKWPGMIHPGRKTIETVSLNDLFSTMADITAYQLPADAGEDSYSLMPLINSQANMYERKSVIHHSADGFFAIRKGKWKLIVWPGSEGTSSTESSQSEEQPIHGFYLYDLDNDPREQTNLATDHPEIVDELKDMLMQDIEEGRSTPGPRQENTPAENWPENKLGYGVKDGNKQ